MAEFTAIPDANLEPDKPARSIDALALRDNPIAIAEGAAGAPRIRTAAIQDLAVTSAKLATGTTERDWVLARNAGASVGAVGTYAFLRPNNSTAYGPGATLAGSNLRYSGAASNTTVSVTVSDGGTPAGTWRCMGNRAGIGEVAVIATLWLRIS